MKKLKDIFYYIQGNIRYELYYSDYKWLLPRYIIEQFEYRVKVMDKRCFKLGQCIMCGCKTTALQMADKACDKPCYPYMMSKKEWNLFKETL